MRREERAGGEGVAELGLVGEGEGNEREALSPRGVEDFQRAKPRMLISRATRKAARPMILRRVEARKGVSNLLSRDGIREPGPDRAGLTRSEGCTSAPGRPSP
jgi:hypothetical protein